MTDFTWTPRDVEHYLEMQRAVADEIRPGNGESRIIAERCGTTLTAVKDWRRRRKIPGLQGQPRGRSLHSYNRQMVVGEPIGGPRHNMLKGCWDEPRIARRYRGRKYEDVRATDA